MNPAEWITASTPSSARLTRSITCFFRFWASSRRANSNKSLIRRVIRSASLLMSFKTRSAVSGSSFAPRINTSVKPRIDVNGVRSWWEASEMKRRNRCSEDCCAFVARSSCSPMILKLAAILLTSSSPFMRGKRRFRCCKSPRVIAWAVSDARRKGRSK